MNKSEIRNPKSETNPKPQTASGKRYDLEERTLTFARRVRTFVMKLPKTFASLDDCKQLVRSSGSVGANYIEANEALGKKDFGMRIKICRKEAKESKYWLQLLETNSHERAEQERACLIQEAQELMNIFGAIVRKVSSAVAVCWLLQFVSDFEIRISSLRCM